MAIQRRHAASSACADNPHQPSRWRPARAGLDRHRVLVLLAVVAILASAAPVLAAQPRANLADIEDEVMCTICGTTLELSSSPQADRERAFINRLIARGETKQQIEDALVAEYGPDVLAVPSGSGFDLTAWLVPAIAIALAAAAIAAFALRQSRRRAEPPVEPALEASDSARLREDMSHYDL